MRGVFDTGIEEGRATDVGARACVDQQAILAKDYGGNVARVGAVLGKRKHKPKAKV